MSPLDPRFLELTQKDIEIEFWAHHYADQEGGSEEFEDEDFDVAEIMAGFQDADDEEWEEVINDRS